MATANTNGVPAGVVEAIVRELVSQGLVGATQVAAQAAKPKRVAPKVITNSGDSARKFGDITIGKPRGTGFIPGVGLDVDQVDGLIKDLRAAKKQVLAQG